MAHTLVIFGASGDLTSRKLIPALYQLHRKGRLPNDTHIVGVSRTKYTSQAWRDTLASSTLKYVDDDFNTDTWTDFATRLTYVAGDITRIEDFRSLAAALNELDKGSGTRIYYLATAPNFYETATTHLGQAGLACDEHGFCRLVIEKPFGTDLATARQLNQSIRAVFDERQIYRIDHYLGKETVQNMLVLRFANTIFEPVWNRNYVDHVQITVAESVDVGSRAAYYDSAGVLRDMFQNHLLQLLMMTAMEAPARYEADAIRDEKVKVLQAIRPLVGPAVADSSYRGQYDGYTAAEGVAPGSQTATFAALKLYIDNWRWHGVPFYLRSGKAMSCRTTQIVIQFREPPHMIFPSGPRSVSESNRLVIQVQPAEGIQLHFETKVPDAGMTLRQTDLEFNYCWEFRRAMPEAYERLLLDAAEGDASLFARSDEVEAAWTIIDPIVEYWQSENAPSLQSYERGGWGPAQCADWMANDGRQWFDSCPVLT